MSRPAPSSRQRWVILVILAVAQLMVVLDTTIVNIALPSAQKDLGFSNADRQWVITAYALTFGSLLLLGGRMGDRFGRKRVFIVGGAGFALASAVGGAAQSFVMLVAARACQGAFAALLAPAALALVSTTFLDPTERNKAFGVYGAVAGSGASVGLILGGLLTQAFSWRYCMYINLIFAAVAICGAAASFSNDRLTIRPRIDTISTLLVSSGLFSLVFGFSHAETTSWGNPVTITMLVVGCTLVTTFVVVQAVISNPLLPLPIVAERNRAASFLSMGILGAGMFAVLLFLTYYLQLNKGFSPLKTGLAYLPMSLSAMAGSIFGNVKLRPRFGSRPLVVMGMVSSGAGLLYLTRLQPESGYWADIFPALLVAGIGLGIVASSAFNGATLGVSTSDAGVASATVNAMQQIGGSLGVAILSTVALTATSNYLVAHHSRNAIASAMVHGYTVAFSWAVAFFAVGAVLAGLLYTKMVRTELPVSAVGRDEIELLSSKD